MPNDRTIRALACAFLLALTALAVLACLMTWRALRIVSHVEETVAAAGQEAQSLSRSKVATHTLSGYPYRVHLKDGHMTDLPTWLNAQLTERRKQDPQANVPTPPQEDAAHAPGH